MTYQFLTETFLGSKNVLWVHPHPLRHIHPPHDTHTPPHPPTPTAATIYCTLEKHMEHFWGFGKLWWRFLRTTSSRSSSLRFGCWLNLHDWAHFAVNDWTWLHCSEIDLEFLAAIPRYEVICPTSGHRNCLSFQCSEILTKEGSSRETEIMEFDQTMNPLQYTYSPRVGTNWPAGNLYVCKI